METNGIAGQYSHYSSAVSEDKERYNFSPFDIMFGSAVLAILAITAGLYFSLHYIGLSQHWPSLKLLELSVPALFLASFCAIFYFYCWRNRGDEKRIEEDVPEAIADALAESRELIVTFKRKATMSGIYILVIMAKTGEIELGNGNASVAMLDRFASEGKWREKRDRTVKIILTDQFSRQGQEKHYIKCLEERLMAVTEEIEVV